MCLGNETPIIIVSTSQLQVINIHPRWCSWLMLIYGDYTIKPLAVVNRLLHHFRSLPARLLSWQYRLPMMKIVTCHKLDLILNNWKLLCASLAFSASLLQESLSFFKFIYCILVHRIHNLHCYKYSIFHKIIKSPNLSPNSTIIACIKY